jgi:prepilin-type N-terminal cleavage/methylation domain-containing protein
MKKNISSKKTALSLVEVIVSIAILAIIAAFVFGALVMGDRYWRSDLGLLDVHQQARMGIHGMVREIRQKNGTTNITIGNNSSQIDFYMTNVSNEVSYYLQSGQIIREHPTGATRVLANNITSLNFCCGQGATCDADCTSADYVEIRVTASKTAGRTVTFNLSEKVQLRNE